MRTLCWVVFSVVDWCINLDICKRVKTHLVYRISVILILVVIISPQSLQSKPWQKSLKVKIIRRTTHDQHNLLDNHGPRNHDILRFFRIIDQCLQLAILLGLPKAIGFSYVVRLGSDGYVKRGRVFLSLRARMGLQRDISPSILADIREIGPLCYFPMEMK